MLSWILASLLLAAPASEAMPPLEVVAVEQGVQPTTRLELKRLDPRMGSNDPRPVADGAISVDGPEVFLLASGSQRSRLERLYLIRLDFTLHKLVEQDVYREATVHVTLDGRDVRVIDMFPRRLLAGHPGVQAIALSRARQLVAAHQGIAVVDLEPVVLGYRRYARELYWKLEGVAKELSPGAKSVFFLLSVPPQRSAVKASVRYEARVGRWLIDRWFWPGRSRTDSLQVLMRLSGAEEIGR